MQRKSLKNGDSKKEMKGNFPFHERFTASPPRREAVLQIPQ
jgi:hypothetical protein